MGREGPVGIRIRTDRPRRTMNLIDRRTDRKAAAADRWKTAMVLLPAAGPGTGRGRSGENGRQAGSSVRVAPLMPPIPRGPIEYDQTTVRGSGAASMGAESRTVRPPTR